MSPACRFGSDLTNTIRARGHRGLHQEAGHTTVPDQTATDSVPNPRLPIWGRPHTPFDSHLPAIPVRENQTSNGPLTSGLLR